jgi:hypothetical protein
MIHEVEFLSMEARDAFLEQVNNKYSKDFYGLGRPVETVHYLGGGSPAYPNTSNSKLAAVDLSKVSDPVAVGKLAQFLGGRMRIR